MLPPPSDLTEAVNTKTDSAEPRELRSQEAQPAFERSLHGVDSSAQSADDQSVDAEIEGRSAADILWALEQAYQNQEERIRSLEMALRDQQTQAEEPQADQTKGEAESGDATVSQAASETQVAALDRSAGLGSPSDFASQQELAPPREPAQRVASLDEPVEGAAWEENQPALLSQQQVVIVNHYQPVFLSGGAPTRTSSQSPSPPRNSAMSVLEQRRSQMRQDSNQRPPTTNSWVASGFDVYSR